MRVSCVSMFVARKYRQDVTVDTAAAVDSVHCDSTDVIK